MTALATDLPDASARRAVLWRMATPQHLCPSGLKARALLRRQGFAVEDHLLRTREEVDAFKARHGVATTPQVWIDGARVGGHDDLRRHLGLRVHDPKALTYRPVVAVFATALALALAFAWSAGAPLASARTLQWWGGLATALLALQKLRDVEGFSTGFLGYDLLARRAPRYAYAYPWLEALVGVLMVAGALPWLAAPVAILIGGVGAASVVQAVYVEGRALKCACVGGQSNVPLGFVSLTENLLMVAMGAWMLAGMPGPL